ncbi:MAG: amino acid ABC transporter permease [Anaerolineae bacterium]|nr:amino acid ABC transporter permease [Anaerolineae bacterium]
MKEAPNHTGESRVFPITNKLNEMPWWVLIIVLLGALMALVIAADDLYTLIFKRLLAGVVMTVQVTLIAYCFSMIFALILGLARISSTPALYHLSTVWITIIRGVPMLILLFYINFVVGPSLVSGVNSLGRLLVSIQLLPQLGSALTEVTVRDFPTVARSIMALVVGYSAFSSEVFRAGIESIGKGQMEAARSLGMTYWQAMAYVILPQAIRRMLPPLGNDFIAMLKDSSLVSVVGVTDITLLGKQYAAGTFTFFETYNVVAYLYLIMTVGLAMVIKLVEQRTQSQAGN